MGLFNVFNSNGQAKIKSHIKNLIEVAISDGQMDVREFELIIAIAGKFGIKRKDAIAMKENHQEIEFSPPSSYNAKVRLMEDLVEVLLADNEIQEDEKKICKEFAEKLKLNTFMVDDMINVKLNQVRS